MDTPTPLDSRFESIEATLDALSARLDGGLSHCEYRITELRRELETLASDLRRLCHEVNRRER